MPANPSLKKKTAARIAAVQCLYRQSMNNEAMAADTQVEALKARLKDNRDEQKLLIGEAIEPDYTLLKRILSGVTQHQQDIDTRLDGILDRDWTRTRMSPLLIAVLQCSIFELYYDKHLNPAIVTDEYTRLSRRFFAEAEVSFVHGALRRLAELQHG